MTDRYLAKLSTRHQQLARLLVGGHAQSEIARVLSVHKSTVSRLVRDPLVIGEIQRLQEMADVHSTACVPGIPEKIQEGAHMSAKVLIEILEDERDDPEMLRLKANVSLELLSRAGYGPIRQVKVEQASFSAYLTKEDIEEIKRRAKGDEKDTESKIVHDT